MPEAAKVESLKEDALMVELDTSGKSIDVELKPNKKEETETEVVEEKDTTEEVKETKKDEREEKQRRNL